MPYNDDDLKELVEASDALLTDYEHVGFVRGEVFARATEAIAAARKYLGPTMVIIAGQCSDCGGPLAHTKTQCDATIAAGVRNGWAHLENRD